MTYFAGILAKIVAVLALVLSVPAQADGIFTIRLGYSNYPHYGGYYNDWPDQFWYGYWPFFYAPVYFSNYYPFYYPFYPSYYYSNYYYRPYLPFYYGYRYYPWYSYPNYGHYRHDHDGHHRHDRHRHTSHDHGHKSHDHYSSLDPRRNHDRDDHRRSYKRDNDSSGQNRHYNPDTNFRRAPVTTFREGWDQNREPGDRSLPKPARAKPEVARFDRNI
ncbi:MAG: hypothetical protein ACRESK_04980, partial [Gammaproteobacteria bacterium]